MSTLLDPDTIVLDETILDDTACCTFDEAPAEWLAGCKSCPARVQWCGEHHDRTMRRAEEPLRSWFCKACGVRSTDWHAQFFTVPI